MMNVQAFYHQTSRRFIMLYCRIHGGTLDCHAKAAKRHFQVTLKPCHTVTLRLTAMGSSSNQAEKEGTVEPLVPWTVVGRPVDGRRTAGGRSSAARVSSAAPKKKSFDRGGPVWPPRSNVTNDRLGGLCPPSKI